MSASGLLHLNYMFSSSNDLILAEDSIHTPSYDVTDNVDTTGDGEADDGK